MPPSKCEQLKEFKEQYEKTIEGYRELGILKTLSSGQEGITRVES